MLIDSYGRTLDYLRVSITDRCNLRCVYCMPPDGVEWKPHESLLSFEELLRLCQIMAELGIRKIKVSGGEPLVRKGAAFFIKSLKGIPGIASVTLTTNGLLLGKYLDEANSLPPDSLPDAVNISLDALDPELYKKITRSAGPEGTAASGHLLSDQRGSPPGDVLLQIDRLLEKQINVKINCVPVRGLNESEILPLLALAKNMNIAVRFIELMPLGSAFNYNFISGGEIMALIEKKFGALEPYSGILGNGPAKYYSIPGFFGKVGFISPLSHSFCETCNRLRLTSSGLLKLCLGDDTGTDLKAMLRSGSSSEEISGAIIKAAAGKPCSHKFLETANLPPADIKKPETGGMFETGG